MSSPLIQVEFTGKAGGGKTTLIPLVAKELGKHLGQNQVLYGQIKPGLRFALKTLLLRPRILSKAHSLSASMQVNFSGNRGYKEWVKRLIKHFWLKSGFSCRNSKKVILIDQGIVHSLKQGVQPLPDKHLSYCPLPDVVVNINISWTQSAWRQVLRPKTPRFNEILTGLKRQQVAKIHAKRFLKDLNDLETLTYLDKWSEKFCDPPLLKDTLQNVINEAKNEPPIDTTQNDNYQNWLKESLINNGVYWLDVNTADHSSPENSSNIITQYIVDHLKAK